MSKSPRLGTLLTAAALAACNAPDKSGEITLPDYVDAGADLELVQGKRVSVKKDAGRVVPSIVTETKEDAGSDEVDAGSMDVPVEDTDSGVVGEVENGHEGSDVRVEDAGFGDIVNETDDEIESEEGVDVDAGADETSETAEDAGLEADKPKGSVTFYIGPPPLSYSAPGGSTNAAQVTFFIDSTLEGDGSLQKMALKAVMDCDEKGPFSDLPPIVSDYCPGETGSASIDNLILAAYLRDNANDLTVDYPNSTGDIVFSHIDFTVPRGLSTVRVIMDLGYPSGDSPDRLKIGLQDPGSVLIVDQNGDPVEVRVVGNNEVNEFRGIFPADNYGTGNAGIITTVYSPEE